ncbi:MAG TPA: hypothetical protein VID77_03170 [Stellaceae bacterium]
MASWLPSPFRDKGDDVTGAPEDWLTGTLSRSPLMELHTCSE